METIAENNQLAKKHGGQQTSSAQSNYRNDLIQCIVGLTNAMKADFGRKYQSQFATEEDLKIYKNRLYTLLNGHAVSAIEKGYEMLMNTAPEWPPTAPDILAFTKQCEKEIAAEIKNREEAKRLAALPAPTIEVNAIEMLVKAKSAASGKTTKEEEAQARADALKNHEAVLKIHGHKIKRRYAQPSHYCAVDGCRKPGGLSGGGNFYCANHYRMQA
jgi:hypothetical protein